MILARIHKIHTIFLGLFLFLLLGCSTAQIKINKSYDFTKIKRFAVLDFESYPGRPRSGSFVADEFSFNLVERKEKLVDRKHVQKILKEQHLGQTGALESETAAKTGKLLGVDVVVIGSIEYLDEPELVKVDYKDFEGKDQTYEYYKDARIGLHAKIIDVETGQVIGAGFSEGYGVNIERAAQTAVSEMVRQFELKVNKWLGNFF